MTSKPKALASLSKALSLVGTPEGAARLNAHLESEPFPHFEPHPTVEHAFIRIKADGTRMAGRFIDRVFVPLD